MKTFRKLFLVSLFLVPIAAYSDEEVTDESMLSSLTENEFFIKKIEGEVVLIVHDFQYNQLKSVLQSDNLIEVSKTFNSMMKLPCILRYDSISLGAIEARLLKKVLPKKSELIVSLPVSMI